MRNTPFNRPTIRLRRLGLGLPRRNEAKDQGEGAGARDVSSPRYRRSQQRQHFGGTIVLS